MPIHFLKVCCEKTSLLWYSPHVGRLHLLFITSWLYFSSKFQAGVQSARRETLPVCVCVCARLLFLFVSMPNEPPSRSGITTQIQFLPYRNISQYVGIYRLLILAGQRLVCVLCECVFPVVLHKAHMHLKVGGSGTCHAATQVFRLHYNSN